MTAKHETPSPCLYCNQAPAEPGDDFCQECNEFDARPSGVIWAEQCEERDILERERPWDKSGLGFHR